MNKSWLCRLGFHQWYTEVAMFSHASRCNRCSQWADPYAAGMLRRERALWQELGENVDPGKVAAALHSSGPIFLPEDGPVGNVDG